MPTEGNASLPALICTAHAGLDHLFETASYLASK